MGTRVIMHFPGQNLAFRGADREEALGFAWQLYRSVSWAQHLVLVPVSTEED